MCLKARPKTVNTELSSNRYLNEKVRNTFNELFEVPPYPGKRAIHNWRFFIKPGKAATGPPVGQEFSKLGLKPMDFCKAFNDKTKPAFKDGIDLMCRVQVYHDLTYSWRLETPPQAWFIMQATRKKRRETGPLDVKGRWAGYITMEMCYEIAKYKLHNYVQHDYPPIEDRARAVARSARRMGIAIIGVDAPNSPVKGMTPAQYDKQAAEYRRQQWPIYEAFKQKELENAPLMNRAHRPEVLRLTYKQLREGVENPELFNALYVATRQKSRYVKDSKAAQDALGRLQHHNWLGNKVTVDEARRLFTNWRIGRVERERHESGVYLAEEAFTRDDRR